MTAVSWTRFDCLKPRVGAQAPCTAVGGPSVTGVGRSSCAGRETLLWALSGALGVIAYHVCAAAAQVTAGRWVAAADSASDAESHATHANRYAGWIKEAS